MTPTERRKFILAHHPDWKVGRELDVFASTANKNIYRNYYYTLENGMEILHGYCDTFTEEWLIKDIKDSLVASENK